MSFSPEFNDKLEQARRAEKANEQARQARITRDEDLTNLRKRSYEKLLPDILSIGRTAALAYNRGELVSMTSIGKLGPVKFRDWRRHQAYQESTIIISGWILTSRRVRTPGHPSESRTATGEMDYGYMHTEAYQDVLISTNGSPYLAEHQGPTTATSDERLLLNTSQSLQIAESTSLSQNPLRLNENVNPNDLISFPVEEEMLQGMADFMRRAHLL